MADGEGDTVHIKVVVVGDGAVGKTTMLVRYVENKFPENYVPTVFENYYHDVEIEGVPVNLGLWDTAGQEDFDRLRSLSYNDTDLVLVVFSVDAPSSLGNTTTKWVPEVEHHCEGVPFMLIGTKSDLRADEVTLEKLKARNQKVVTVEEAEQVANDVKAEGYMECSALTGEGVKAVFEKAMRIVLTRQGRLKTNERKGCCTVM